MFPNSLTFSSIKLSSLDQYDQGENCILKVIKVYRKVGLSLEALKQLFVDISQIEKNTL